MVNRAPKTDHDKGKFTNYDTGAQVLSVPEDASSATSTMTPISGQGGSAGGSQNSEEVHSELVEALYAVACRTGHSAIEKALLTLTTALAAAAQQESPVDPNESFASVARQHNKDGEGEADHYQYSKVDTTPSHQSDTYSSPQERHGSVPPFCNPCAEHRPTPSNTRARD